MKFKQILKWIYCIVLAELSIEILVRRWIFMQIPTQVGVLTTYAVIAINGFVLAMICFGRPSGSTKMDRN